MLQRADSTAKHIAVMSTKNALHHSANWLQNLVKL